MNRSLNYVTVFYAGAYKWLTALDTFEIVKVLKEQAVASANACVLATALRLHKCLGKVLSSKENMSEEYFFVFIKCLLCALYHLEVCFLWNLGIT